MDRKIGLGIAFAVVLGCAVPALAQEAVQWRVEDGGNGHWFQIETSSDITHWSNAVLRASQVGGHLATLANFQERSWVFSFAAHDPIESIADLNDDGTVGVADISVLLCHWGLSETDVGGDLSGDGTLNVTDLSVLLGSWGECK